MFGAGGHHGAGLPLQYLRRLESSGVSRQSARALLEARYGDALSPTRLSNLVAVVYGRMAWLNVSWYRTILSVT